MFTRIEMHGFCLFVSIQLHRLEGADLRERDKIHLLCQALKSLNYP